MLVYELTNCFIDPKKFRISSFGSSGSGTMKKACVHILWVYETLKVYNELVFFTCYMSILY